jgi:hypothetical protein
MNSFHAFTSSLPLFVCHASSGTERESDLIAFELPLPCDQPWLSSLDFGLFFPVRFTGHFAKLRHVPWYAAVHRPNIFYVIVHAGRFLFVV